jgi:PAS domain S-box-containing protein
MAIRLWSKANPFAADSLRINCEGGGRVDSEPPAPKETDAPESLQSQILDAAGIGLFRYRFDGTLVAIDRVTMRIGDLLGVYPDPAEVVGKNIRELFRYVEPEGAVRAEVREQGKVQAREYPLETLTGLRRWVRHDSFLVRDPQTGEEQVQAVIQEITATKLAEEALVDSQERIHVLLESAEDIVFAVDPAGRFQFANLRAARLLGFASAEELVGRRMADLFPPEHAKRQLAAVQAVVDTDQPVRTEAAPTQVAGQELWFSTVLSPVHGSDGLVQGILGIARDITRQVVEQREHKSIEEKMRHAQKLEGLGLLAGGIAHDFNNLLVAVLGNADLALMDLPPGSAAGSAIEQIRTAALRASDLTNQMLAYSGRGRFETRVLDLNRSVKEMAHLLKVAIPRRVQLQFDLSADLPPVQADPAQLQQVIMNLVTNAAEACQADGVVQLRTAVVEGESAALQGMILTGTVPGCPCVQLEVTDSGVGMAPEVLERIFDPFYTTKFHGRGLGLASVLGIVRGHAGAIGVSSQPGRGTSFLVLLPASAEAPDVLDRDSQSLGCWRASGRVLLVDDEAVVRQVASQMLRRMGLEVVEAADGSAALDVLQHQGRTFALVLLDLTMPRMDGAEVFRRVRQHWPDLPVVLCSGYSEVDTVGQFEGDRPAGFLQKPFEYLKLAEILRGVLGERPGQKRLIEPV